jgi:cold shock CspA family protein
MTKFSDEAADYDLVYQMDTDAAFLFKDLDDDDVWLPKSAVEVGGTLKRGQVVSVTIPNWLAEAKGLT